MFWNFHLHSVIIENTVHLLLCHFASAAPEELEEERQRRMRAAEEVKVKDEPQEMEVQIENAAPKPDAQSPRTRGLEKQNEEENEHRAEKNSLFYQQSGCVSKLRTFQDASKDEAVPLEGKESPRVKQNGSPLGIPVATVTSSPPLLNISEPAVASAPSIVMNTDATNASPPASTSLSGSCPPTHRDSVGDAPFTSSPAPSPHLTIQANDQLLRVLTERSGHWFSLLPRNPCDLSSLTTTPPGAPRVSPQASSTPARPKSPPQSPALPLTPSAASASGSPHHPAGLLNYPLSALQVRLEEQPQKESAGFFNICLITSAGIFLNMHFSHPCVFFPPCFFHR